MSDLLTLARATPLGPYVPATKAMLTGWCGPCEVRGLSATVCYATEDRYRVDVHVRRSCLVRLSDIRLDCRRPEVRWRLVDLGLLPVALRDHPGAAVAAGMGVKPWTALAPWRSDRSRVALTDVDTSAEMWIGDRAVEWFAEMHAVNSRCYGWRIYLCGGQQSGPETGEAGRRAADLAALRLGCVLEEPDGYLIPLPDGGVGFVSKESP